MRDRGERVTGGPSSGGITILRFPPGFISLIPSSNPVSKFSTVLVSFISDKENTENLQLIKYVLSPGINALVPNRTFAGEPCKYVLSIRRPDSL